MGSRLLVVLKRAMGSRLLVVLRGFSETVLDS
jgi:hypothetical protein